MEPPAATTEETYKKIIAAEGLPEDVETLNGFSLLWIGSRTAKKVIVYACGGALVSNAYDAHIQFLISNYKTVQANSQDISIVVVAYGLCPVVAYPTPIRHLVQAVSNLLQFRTPESIILSGDSAGGLLVLAALLHHAHPHPNIDPYALPPGSRFAEAFLICPGGPVPSSTPSMLAEPVKDIINPTVLGQIFGLLGTNLEAGIEIPNAWLAPATAPEEWWKGLPVGKVTFIAGDWEVLRDDILIVGRHVKKYHDEEVIVRTFAREIHEQALIDLQSGQLEKENGSAKFWKAWFQDLKA